jgi:hypothetical protein
MARIIPDGASSSPVVPAPDAVAWSTVYEVDFTDMGAAKDTDWRTDGDSASVVLDGGYGDSATWIAHSASQTQANIITSASICKLEDGVGLQIKPENGTNLWADVTNAPKVLSKVIDLVSGMTLDDTVCIQLRANADKDPLEDAGQDDIAQFGLYIGALAASQGTKDWGKNVTLLQGSLYAGQVQGETGIHYGRTTNADFYEIIIYPYKGSTAGTLRMAAGDWGGDWPSPGGTYTATTFANLNRTLNAAGTSTNMGVSDLYVGLSAASLDLEASNLPIVTAYQLRVLKVI